MKKKERTVLDNAAHQIGRENTYVEQKQQNIETAKGGESTIRRNNNLIHREDDRVYDKIHKINDTKQQGGFYKGTLLVNNVPIKFIIDSVSPVTFVPECFITTIKPLIKM